MSLQLQLLIRVLIQNLEWNVFSTDCLDEKQKRRTASRTMTVTMARITIKQTALLPALRLLSAARVSS